MSGDSGDPPPQIAGAITYPGPSGNTRPVPVQPRQPHNLQGLLRFAMEATQDEDAPGAPTIGPIDEERRKFLEEALRSLTVDVARVLQDAVRVLSDAERVRAVGMADECPDDIADAFANVTDFVDDIDVANDFYKIGGFSVFPVVLSAQNDSVRANGCKLLGVLTQNNPYTQARALETGLINVLISMAENEQAPRVLSNTAMALSCAMREFEPSSKEFIAQNGCDVLLRLLNFDDITVRTKAAFLTRYFCKNYPDARAKLLQKNLVSRLVELLKGERDMSSEHILGTLAALAEDQDSNVLDQLQSPSIRLKSIVERYMKNAGLEEGTDFVEEKEYCEELLKVVGTGRGKQDEDVVER